MKYFLGIEIGGTKLQLFVGDETNQVLEEIRMDVTPDRSGEAIRSRVEASIRELQNAYRFSAVGVGFGGPVDWERGQIIQSHQVDGWGGFDLADWLEDLARCPVSVENDANVAALGEALIGSGKNFETVFYITLGSGVGGGLIQEGAIYHGARPGESEVGHLLMDRSGTTLESVASGWAVDARIRETIAQHPDCALAGLVTGDKEARFLVPAVAEKDPIATTILTDTAENIAFGLSHVVHLFHPEILVLGGGLSLCGETLRQEVETRMAGYVMKAFQPLPRVALAQLREDAVPMGALLMARQKLGRNNFE
ncbi:MAG: ROK family protein [Siphonobacter aquaeclarae]|nr:ROK family protein [Siphonobacter aquaeclarae]